MAALGAINPSQSGTARYISPNPRLARAIANDGDFIPAAELCAEIVKAERIAPLFEIANL